MQESYYKKALKLQKSVDSSSDVIFTIDKLGHFIEISKASTKIFGYNPAELAGRKFLDFIYKLDKKRSQIAFMSIMTNDLSNNFQSRFIKKDGTLIFVMWSAYWDSDDDAMYFIARDITALKVTQYKLAESKKRFKSLVEKGSDIIGIVDKRGNYTFVSKNVKPLLNFHPRELIRKNTIEFIHPEDKTTIFEQLTAIQQGQFFDGLPVRFKNKNGEWRWLEARITNCLHDPTIRGIVINARDITEKKLLQEQLRRENELQQTTLTAAILKAQENERQLISRELHDNVNQILATVKLYNEASLNTSDLFREDFIHKSIPYLQLCMQEIRSITKNLSVPTFDRISFVEAVKDLVGSISVTSDFDVSLYVNGLEGISFGEEIKTAAYRIIQEHLSNIIKHAEATSLKITLANINNCLSITITDNGKGFNPKTKRMGIGITNMICRAEALHGHLKLDSAIGKGCTISVTLPLKTVLTASN